MKLNSDSPIEFDSAQDLCDRLNAGRVISFTFPRRFKRQFSRIVVRYHRAAAARQKGGFWNHALYYYHMHLIQLCLAGYRCSKDGGILNQAISVFIMCFHSITFIGGENVGKDKMRTLFYGGQDGVMRRECAAKQYSEMRDK